MSSGNDRSKTKGHLEVLPDGRHRFVADASQPPVEVGKKATLAYETPSQVSRPGRFMRMSGATIGIVLGAAVGFLGAGMLLDLIFRGRRFDPPVGAVFGASVLAAIGCCVCFGFKRNFIAWLLFGASCGLFLLCFMLCVTAGMRHA